jgi:hypothetical protein
VTFQGVPIREIDIPRLLTLFPWLKELKGAAALNEIIYDYAGKSVKLPNNPISSLSLIVVLMDGRIGMLVLRITPSLD